MFERIEQLTEQNNNLQDRLLQSQNEHAILEQVSSSISQASAIRVSNVTNEPKEHRRLGCEFDSQTTALEQFTFELKCQLQKRYG